MKNLILRSAAIIGLLITANPSMACNDNVVLVHGNAASPASWEPTYNELIARGYADSQIFVPSWGVSSNPSLNNHSGSEESPVRAALQDAIEASCSGKIDVIGHSMGVTLAAQQIIKLSEQENVDAFVGIAGANRGLLSCGVYPFNVWTPTCGAYGLSVSSPFLSWLDGKQIADRVFSIKSWIDQVVCATGTCLIYGIHSSRIATEDQTYTLNYGHFGLQTYTYDLQVDLIQ
ncbi:hypothetical protein NBRC116583_07060 [Arenicella sp. 4NH20-0111]|uniref:alpha/beta fold hydrolase n=1 Tax=Arenicella sp. 4NH20-0111 TaxID=3127648 RepID=UPI0031080B34